MLRRFDELAPTTTTTVPAPAAGTTTATEGRGQLRSGRTARRVGSPRRSACSRGVRTGARAAIGLLVLGATLLAVRPAPASAAPASWVGGWVLPSHQTSVTSGGGWLAQGAGCPRPSGYVAGKKHLGLDFGAASGTSGKDVFAVGAGTVLGVVANWDGEGNSAISIRHTAADGTTFVALYGHVRAAVTSGKVTRGQKIGTMGAYSGGTHVHFGIAPNGLPSTQQGANSCQTTSTNGLVDPYAHLKGHPATVAGFDPCAYRGWVVGANGTAAKYLVQNDCKRAHIPTGGDYQSIVANVGSGRVRTFATVAEMNRIASNGRTVRTARVDDPAITGPTQWIHRRTGVGNVAHDGDYSFTYHALGRPLTNEGRWDLGVSAPGVYRIKCFIPNSRDAWAGVLYRVHDGNTQRFAKALRQADHKGWTHLGDATVTAGVVKIRLRDHEGAGPYNERFAYDACEAVPIR